MAPWVEVHVTTIGSVFPCCAAENDEYIGDTSKGDTLLDSWNSDGFVVGNLGEVNGATQDMVAWNWKAGTTTGLSGGTITPTSYSINTTSGFGIYKYTGTGSAGTIAHGLGVIPKLIVVKRLNSSSQWSVYHESLGNTKHLILNTTAIGVTSTNYWNDTSPTSSVFSIGSGTDVNANGGTYIAYIWAEVRGYSRFRRYVGNGVEESAGNGQMCQCGFKPAYVMIKKGSSSAGPWQIMDKTRLGYNPKNYLLKAEATAAEVASSNSIDILSNGFKIRSGNAADWNENGTNYYWWAFADSALVSSTGIPSTAE